MLVYQTLRLTRMPELFSVVAGINAEKKEKPAIPPRGTAGLKPPCRDTGLARSPLAESYPLTGTFENTSITLPVVGRPKLIAGRKVLKISMFLISGESCPSPSELTMV